MTCEIKTIQPTFPRDRSADPNYSDLPLDSFLLRGLAPKAKMPFVQAYPCPVASIYAVNTGRKALCPSTIGLNSGQSIWYCTFLILMEQSQASSLTEVQGQEWSKVLRTQVFFPPVLY